MPMNVSTYNSWRFPAQSWSVIFCFKFGQGKETRDILVPSWTNERLIWADLLLVFSFDF